MSEEIITKIVVQTAKLPQYIKGSNFCGRKSSKYYIIIQLLTEVVAMVTDGMIQLRYYSLL